MSDYVIYTDSGCDLSLHIILLSLITDRYGRCADICSLCNCMRAGNRLPARTSELYVI